LENTRNHIEDFLTDESFKAWIQQPTPELNARWSAWLDQHPEKKELAARAAEVMRRISFEEHTASPAVKQRILARLQADSGGIRRTGTGSNWFFRVAAMLVLAAGLGASAVYFFPENTSSLFVHERIKQNEIGQKSSVRLSDGTVVHLNASSKLTYPAAFDNGERTVYLSGEAYFDVAHDAARPFRVKTDGLDILVLGTEFNVKAGALTNQVSLVEGKVRLIASNNAKTELEPGQQVTYTKDQELFAFASFDTRYVTGWKDGLLVFKNASFNEAITRLHEWYGIKIVIRNPEKTPEWSYTAAFENESLENVLQNMRALRGFEYSIKNDTLAVAFQ
jgi:ferric-dicitrate binding protein FerR (iron transport regulator)